MPPALTVRRTAGVRHGLLSPSPDRVELAASTDIVAEGAERDGSTRLLDAGYTLAREQIAALLQLVDPAEEVWTRRFLISNADGDPIQLVTSHIARSLAEGTPLSGHMQLSRAALDAHLREELDLVQGRVRDDVTSRMPTPEEVRALRLLPGTPVLDILRTFIATTRRPIELLNIVMPGDTHVVVYEKATVMPRRPAPRTPSID